jgi:outer membrane protein insertion porin family
VKKRNLTFALSSLILGALIGVGIIGLKAFIKKELIEMLDDMARESIGCSFEHDRITIYFSRLKAKAFNPRFVCDGKAVFGFKELEAKFGLESLDEHEITLTKLTLKNGFSIGATLESPIYKFIDFLVAPIPPEEDYPGRWSLKLNNLELLKSRVYDKFGDIEVIGRGISLNLSRTPDDYFLLKPKIGRLIVKSHGENTALFTKIMTDISLLDDKTDFQNFSLSGNTNPISGSLILGRVPSRTITGKFESEIASETVNLPFKDNAPLKTQLSLDGTPGDLKARAKIENKNSPIKISDSDLTFENLSTEIILQAGPSGLKVTASPEGTGPGVSLATSSPVTLKDGKLSGELRLALDSISGAGVSAYGLNSSITFGGTLEDPEFSVKATTKLLGTLSNYLADLNASISSTKDDLRINLFDNNNGFNLQANIYNPEGAIGEIKSGQIFAKAVPLFRRSLLGETTPSPLALSVNGNMSGALTEDKIKLDAKVEVIILPKNIPLVNIAAHLDRGNAKLEFSSSRKDIDGAANLDLVKNSGGIVLNLNNFSPQNFDSKAQCAKISGAIDYKYGAKKAAGTIDLKSAVLGCEPYTLTLTNPQILYIKEDSINFGQLIFAGKGSSLIASGSVGSSSGIDLQTKGEFNLHTIAPLVPSLDDLKGDIKIDLRLKGQTDALNISGKASIKNGILSTQASDITIDDIEGSFVLDGRNIYIESFTGSANDGTIEINGNINLDNPKETIVSARLADIYMSPISGANIWASGTLSLETDESDALSLMGQIQIDRGEMERNLTLRSLIQGIISSPTRSSPKSKSSGPENIKLNIDINAPRNLFLIANWADLEMKTALKVGGTVKEPSIMGNVETLSGWFGLNARRFSITSGKVVLAYPSQEPFIDATAETQATASSGESILIMLDVRGPVSNPKIKFSSDSGLSVPELTKLLAKGGFAVSGSLIDVVTGKEGKGSLKNSFLNFLKSLTDIDSLGIEPGYNQRTGTVGPVLVAEKYVTSRVKIVGKNTLSAEAKTSSIFGSLQLTPALSVVSGFEDLPLEERVAYSADLKYAVIKTINDFIKIEISGNEAISNRSLLETLRLTAKSRVPKDEAARFSESIKTLYKSKGYYQTETNIECTDDGQFCRKLNIGITEGPPAYLKSISFEGDPIDSFVKKISLPKIGSIAGKETLTEIKGDLIKALRSEGYIAASVKTSFILNDEKNSANMAIRTQLGEPYTFIFTGNKLFKAEDFLQTINLFNRTQPFGENTSRILLENIERLYRESGYLYVTISYETRPPDKTGRKVHYFKIEEGQKIGVRKVKVKKISPLSLKEFAKAFAKDDEAQKADFLKPIAAVQEEIDYFSELMVSKLRDIGYPNASVTGVIKDQGNNSVDIVYEVTPENLLSYSPIKIIGLPKTIKAPEIKKDGYSVPQINRLIERITENLKGNGYKTPTVYTTFEECLTIAVEAGPQTMIRSIEIVGLENVQDELVRSYLNIKVGDPWIEEQVSQSNRHLLSLGLFSRIDIMPSDGDLDEPLEDIIVKLEERNLRSLDLGVGYNSAYGPHLSAEYVDREIFADGRILGLNMDTYHDAQIPDISRGTLSVRYIDPFFWGDYVRLTEDARIQKLDNGILPYNLDRISLLSFLDFSKSSTVKATLGHTLMSENLSDVEPDAVLSSLDNGKNLLSVVSSSITLDKRDSALLPTEGYLVGLDGSLADRIIGSDANYMGAGLQGTIYLPLDNAGTLTLSNNIRFGALIPFGDTEEIPISQRFFLGGHNTIRGFRENSVGPKGENGSSIGGDILGYTNVELQYNLNDYLQLASFFDAGTTTLQSQDFSMSDIRESAGVGTRVLTPLGAFSLYAGFPLDERKGESSVRFHFNIGAQF